MNVVLLQQPEHPEQIIAQAGRLCYSAAGIEALAEKMTPEKSREQVELLVSLGHFSALEHAVFTFGVEGVSRVLTHQLVRHRLASYSQQSQRYVAMRDFAFVTPPSLSDCPELFAKYQTLMKSIGIVYQELLEAKIPAEDARYVLPNACETKIIITMNARELLHFSRLRCCNRAQWEIHQLADEMLRLAREVAPAIFRKAGPGCLSGPCPEGKLSCGQTATVREKYTPKT